MRILNATQMREADRRTIEEIGVPSIVLMENAGREVVSALEAEFADLASRRVAVMAGRGNNGGDGFVVARTLRQRGVSVGVFLVGRADELKGDARINLGILTRLGAPVVEVPDLPAWRLQKGALDRFDLFIDALVGTGLASGLTGLLDTVVNDLNAMDRPVVAIDLPSGMSADTQELVGPSLRAVMTVTLGAPKLPLVMAPAMLGAGKLVVADIGIPLSVIDLVEGTRIELLTRGVVQELVQPRTADAHKGQFGHVLIVAGSRGKTGAAHLAAEGALRSGAGLVTVATPRDCQATVASMGAEYMTEGLTDTADGTIAASAVGEVLGLGHDVIAAGPGLGQSLETRAFVQSLVERADAPVVLDADALNAFMGTPEALIGREGRDVIVTPHPGEMARLLNVSVQQIQADRLEAARSLATRQRLYVVLKGHRTVIATPDGKAFINPTGNPGMATGGTGDVLTGMIAAWLGQLLDAEAACKLGVYLHGAAGDLAAADEGEISMTAGDLAARIGDALLDLTARLSGRR